MNQSDADKFLKLHEKRRQKLVDDIPYLTVEEARERYRLLFEGCPIELHIDDFSIIKILEKKFKDYHIEGVTKRTFKIKI